MVRLFRKILLSVILWLFAVCLLFVIGTQAYIHHKMSVDGTSYTETVENILVGMVPENGITIKGRTYDAWSLRSFLDEIRYDPYNYMHKDHHCILADLEESDIRRLVTLLRIVLGCG